MKNSSGKECILEFSSIEERKDWTQHIVQKAEEIDAFLKKDKFQFGNFGSISTSFINSKIEEALVQEQLDNKNNFDHLVDADPEQLDQSYEIHIGQLTLITHALTKFKLKSKSIPNSESNDELVLSS